MAATRTKAITRATTASSPAARNGNRSSALGTPRSTTKTKPKPNGSILNFFQKTDSPLLHDPLFMADKRGSSTGGQEVGKEGDLGWGVSVERGDSADTHDERFNEDAGRSKRRKTDSSLKSDSSPTSFEDKQGSSIGQPIADSKVEKQPRRAGPFLEDSDSEDDMPATIERRLPTRPTTPPENESRSVVEEFREAPVNETTADIDPQELFQGKRPTLKREATSYDGIFDPEEFEDEYAGGEEFQERLFMEMQRKLELAESGMVEDDAEDLPWNESALVPKREQPPMTNQEDTTSQLCPICNMSLAGMQEAQVLVHVNGCLDGTTPQAPTETVDPSSPAVPISVNAQSYKKIPRPGQPNPFAAKASTNNQSAFSRLMSGHAEDAAWKSAAAEENASRGKPAYQRTCPFYKIMPGFSTCVDAFRYGAVEGCNAYFLSHFHSDHYIGLTSTWTHGPIYCSGVTGNLVRQQLRVDPKYVVDLEFEVTSEVPNTDGMKVTMIPANHCPGSSLFLFEKAMGKGRDPYIRRVLHCGDFRACRAHVEHPLLRPDVLDVVSGKSKRQKLDVCYLDTTYLNPRYAFPSQDDVMKACAEKCVSFNEEHVGDDDNWHAKGGNSAVEMAKFVQRNTEGQDNDSKSATPVMKGRLLVVVGTYSIGKERICLAIARALKSKIYATPYKQRICACLEDPELNSLLTSDPREAQVHMTPLGEIRPEILGEYLESYRDRFDRAVAFRPSGWNYKPPSNRSLDTVTVQTVLHNGGSWRSPYYTRDLVPQRGSTKRVRCFGVPYSEHSSFRELTMFCCALQIDKIIPTVNVGSPKSRERMKAWCDKWAADRKKNGLFKPGLIGW